jgi:predicted nucleic acid-binding protein
MILVDTSVWIDHLRENDPQVSALLLANNLLTHPFIVGELACGSLKNRANLLALMQGLPQLPIIADPAVLRFIEDRQLMGLGIGYIDAHLLCAAAHHATHIWTRDKRLNRAAKALSLGWEPDVH